MAMAPTELGRRERKKDQTRRALVEAAVALFAARGFEATTVEDIADAVDVSSRTFHRYFPAKEDVLFADSIARRDLFDEALAERPADEDVLESLRAASHALAASIEGDVELEVARHALIDVTPALQVRALGHTEAWARTVASHTARRLDLEPDDPLPQLLAACTVAALRNASRRWAARPTTDLRREFDRGFDLIGNLRDATASPTTTKRTR